MRANSSSEPQQYGVAPVGISRYFALYITQIGWLTLGVYLLASAYWPSTCHPKGLLDLYGCSLRLPESGGWVEATLMTWLWTTPLLIALEILRRFNKPQRR